MADRRSLGRERLKGSGAGLQHEDGTIDVDPRLETRRPDDIKELEDRSHLLGLFQHIRLRLDRLGCETLLEEGYRGLGL